MTVLADFPIYGDGREVRVVAYDNLKGMRIAATLYDNADRARSARVRGAHAETCGLCHRFEWLDDGGHSHPMCAIVRLAEPHLGIGIVTHEVAHAAVWIHELNEGPRPIVTDNDEPFVWMLGDLVRQAVVGLTDAGVYER